MGRGTGRVWRGTCTGGLSISTMSGTMWCESDISDKQKKREKMAGEWVELDSVDEC